MILSAFSKMIFLKKPQEKKRNIVPAIYKNRHISLPCGPILTFQYALESQGLGLQHYLRHQVKVIQYEYPSGTAFMKSICKVSFSLLCHIGGNFQKFFLPPSWQMTPTNSFLLGYHIPIVTKESEFYRLRCNQTLGYLIELNQLYLGHVTQTCLCSCRLLYQIILILNTIVDIDPGHYEHYFEHSIFNLFISRQFATSEQK